MILRTAIALLLLAAAAPSRALAAAACTNPGKDGPGTALSGVLNSYYPGVSGTAGSASVTVGVIDTSSGGSNKAIAAGDLILVMQMQDADLSTSNDSGYGGSSPGAGQLALNNAGAYEYATVAASYAGGTTLPLTAALQNSYRSAAATGSNGQRTFQVIRVPQYSAVKLTGGVQAVPWNGATGGVVAIDVAGQLDWNGNTIDATGRGFRGGGGLYLKGKGASQPAYASTDYLSTLLPTNPLISPNPGSGLGPFPGANGAKGEGIAGTPRYLFVPAVQGVATIGLGAVLDTGSEGYPNGCMGRGAPGNAGGGGTDGDPQTANNGGNDQNTGGGGGGGAAAGGMGGYGWTPGTPPGSRTGGFGGEGVPMAAARLTLGGGGGAGTSNNGTGTPTNGLASSGAPGGGLVLVRAKTIVGSGTVTANGSSGNATVCNDASGGGGGGGAVLVYASGNSGNVGTLAVNVKGGGGGSNTGNGSENSSTCGAYNNNPHGPGGGGGGGFVALSSISNATINVAGGGNGTTSPSATSTAPYGSSSSPGGYQISSVQATDVPGASPSPLCYPLLTVTKVATVTDTVQGGTTAYTITVSNAANYGTATGVVLSDTLPSGLNVAATGAVTLTGGATRTSVANPAAGATSPSWGAFSIPGGASASVSFTANVPAATTPGVLQNPASVVYDDPTRSVAGQTISPGGTDSLGAFVPGSNYNPALSTGEDVTVRLPALVGLAFNPASINAGGTAQLTLTVQNPNGVALTGSAFTDALPPGLVTTASAITVSGPGCTGFTPASVPVNSTSWSQSGGTVPANGTCTFTVNVTAASAQNYLDGFPAASFTNSLNVINVAAAAATLYARPTVALSFSPTSVAANTSDTLTFTISNPGGAALTGASFSDTLPAGLVAVGGAVGGTCTGFTPASFTAGDQALAFTGGNLPAAGCTVTVAVKGTANGAYATSVPGGVTTNETVVAGPASNTAILGVGQIGVAKSFASSSIKSGANVLVTIALTNPTGVAQTSGAFSDTLVGMSVGATAVGGTCTGRTPATLTVGATSVSFATINIPVAGCTVTFTVTSSTVGRQSNTTSGVTTAALTTAGPVSNTATLDVTGPPTLSAAFAPGTIQSGGTSTLTFTLVNGDTIPLTNAAFNDTLNAALSIAGSGSVTVGGTCVGASSLSFAAGTTGALSFTGLTVPTGAGGCTVTIPVTAASASPSGGYTNATSTGVSSAEAATGAVSNTAALLVAAAPTISEAFSTSPISQGGTSTLTFTLSNSSNFALTGGAFSDALGNLTLASGAVGGTCTGASGNVFSAGQGGTLAFSGLTLPSAGTCTVTLQVTSNVSGTQTNSASGVTTAQTPIAGAAAAAASLVVLSPPQASVGFSPGVILSSAASASSKAALTITLTNSNSVSLTNVSFTDTLSQMGIFAAGAATGTCAGVGSNSFAAGQTSLSFSGLTVPSGSCTVIVQVSSGNVSPAAGWPDNTSGVTSTQTPFAGAASPAGYLTVITWATIAKSFSPSSIAAGGTATLQFTLSNSSSIALTGAAFSDAFPVTPGAMTTTGAAQSYIGAGRGTCTGAIPSAGSTVAAGVSFSGISIPANSSCTVLVDVTAAVAGNYANTSSGITTSETGASAGPGSNTATLGVGKLGIAKSFVPAGVGVGEKSTLTIVVSNPAATATGATLIFSDSFPANMTISSPLNVSNGCGGTLRNVANSANSAAGDTGFSLQNGNVAGSSSCTVTVEVTTSAAAAYNNTTSTPTVGGVNAGPASNTATLTVVLKPALAESFSPSPVDAYRNSTMTFTVTNSNAAALTSCNFTDALAGGFFVGSPPSISGTCTGVTSSPALASGATSLNLTIPSLNAGSCTVTLPVTSATAGTYTNASTGLKCAETVSAGAAPSSASVTFNKLPIQLLKSANLSSVPPGSQVTYTIGYANPNSQMPLQNIVITDPTPPYTTFVSAACGTLPASLTSCTITSPAAGAAGTVTFTLGGTLDPGASGTLTLSVTVK